MCRRWRTTKANHKMLKSIYDKLWNYDHSLLPKRCFFLELNPWSLRNWCDGGMGICEKGKWRESLGGGVEERVKKRKKKKKWREDEWGKREARQEKWEEGIGWHVSPCERRREQRREKERGWSSIKCWRHHDVSVMQHTYIFSFPFFFFFISYFFLSSNSPSSSNFAIVIRYE